MSPEFGTQIGSTQVVIQTRVICTIILPLLTRTVPLLLTLLVSSVDAVGPNQNIVIASPDIEEQERRTQDGRDGE